VRCDIEFALVNLHLDCGGLKRSKVGRSVGQLPLELRCVLNLRDVKSLPKAMTH
jgi:hypothetical protein